METNRSFEQEHIEDAPKLDIEELMPNHYERAHRGIRFANYFIDNIIIQAISLGILGLYAGVAKMASVGSFTSVEVLATINGFILSILYFFAMELFFGKTLGKFVTRTQVLDVSGEKPSPKQLLGRSFARLIPFDALSFLFYTPTSGWHDQLSKTVVVMDDSVIR